MIAQLKTSEHLQSQRSLHSQRTAMARWMNAHPKLHYPQNALSLTELYRKILNKYFLCAKPHPLKVTMTNRAFLLGNLV